MKVDYDTDIRDILNIEGRKGSIFFNAVVQCGRDGNRLVVDEKIADGSVVHTLLRRIAVNNVTGTSAIAVAILAISDESATGVSIEH
jgi:hypothetical protein